MTPPNAPRTPAPPARPPRGETAKPAPHRLPPPEGPALSAAQFLALEAPAGECLVEVAGERVALTHLDRLYWPDAGLTKGHLLQYYLRVADWILPYLAGRPAILKRYPRGVGQPAFYQHDVRRAPAFLRVAPLPSREGRVLHYAVYTTPASLLYLANLGAIEQHPWLSPLERLNCPDFLVLDLDPCRATWETIVRVAALCREALAELGLVAFAKTSGSRGIHLYAPLEGSDPYEGVRAAAEAVARRVAEREPRWATVERLRERRRRGQVYIDWGQNACGKTLASPYSVRARPGAPVACPVGWEELEAGARIADFTLRSVPARLAEGRNPWADLPRARRRLPAPFASSPEAGGSPPVGER